MARALHQSVPQTLIPEISSVNPFLAGAIAVQRKIEDGSSLDQFDAEIIDFALRRLIREERIPFQRFRDHYVIGTEHRKILDGADYYRTILMHRKSDIWYPESETSQLSVCAVYVSSQIEPPDPNLFDADRGQSDDYAHELIDRANIGPATQCSYQKILEEAPPDWRIDAVMSVQDDLRRYAQELSRIDSIVAVERWDALEDYLRDQAKTKTKDIAKGELEAVMDAYLGTQSYRGQLRAIRGPKHKIYDAVRSSCKYFREDLLESENPITRAIGKHLADYVAIGQICEYKGNWKWRF